MADDLYDDEAEVLPCPACGAEIYEDAERCPACGEYVVMRTDARSRRPWWWLAAVLALAAMIAYVAFV